METPQDFGLWKFVLSVSDSMAGDQKRGFAKQSEIIAYLETIEEAFNKNNDPIEDFKGFVLLELCRTLKRSLLLSQKSN